MISLGFWVAGLLGKSVGAEAAKKIGLAVGIAIAIIVLGVGLLVGKHLYDKGVVESYRVKQEAAVAKATRAADMAADNALAVRVEEQAVENDKLTTALAVAKEADPVKGTATVGKVQQSYFDNLPVKRKK